MKMKRINCCKNEQATNIKAKQIKDIAKTQNKVKNKDHVSMNSWQRYEHFVINYIIFRNVENFKNYFFQIKKYCER
jgi:hypothetical protein